MIELKEIKKDDYTTIAQMAKHIWYAHYPKFITIAQVDYFLKKFYSAEAIMSQQIQGQQFYFIIYQNEICGFIAFTAKENQTIFINKFYINTKKQGQNIGAKVIQFLEEKYKPIRALELAVNRLNIKSINFYFKVGFKIKSVEDFDIDGKYEMNDFVMEKTMC